MSPGAGWGAKRWPAERYGAVAAELHARGCRVLVNAGPQEQEIAAEVVARVAEWPRRRSLRWSGSSP